MIDRYTKIVLSVIAMALVVLALQNVFPSARAQSEACGTSKNPCWVSASRPFYVEAAPTRPVYIAANPKEPIYVMTPPLQALSVQVSR